MKHISSTICGWMLAVAALFAAHVARAICFLFIGLPVLVLPVMAATTSDSSIASLGLVDLTTSSSGTASTSTSFLSGYGADKLFDDGSLTDASRYISAGSSTTTPSIVTWTFHAATPVNAYLLLNTA